MKKIIYMLGAVVLFTACNNAQSEKKEAGKQSGQSSSETMQADTADAAKFSFEKVRYDFGEAKEGEKIAYAFEFTNTGKSSLIISNAIGSCGCTVPEWPTEPIEPGETGKIDVVFNSAGRTGMQHKTVSIYANTYPKVTKLELVGQVNPAK